MIPGSLGFAPVAPVPLGVWLPMLPSQPIETANAAPRATSRTPDRFIGTPPCAYMWEPVPALIVYESRRCPNGPRLPPSPACGRGPGRGQALRAATFARETVGVGPAQARRGGGFLLTVGPRRRSRRLASAYREDRDGRLGSG